MQLFTKAILIAATMAGMAPLRVQASTENPSILPTPPMGFNNWNRFMCELNETLFIETAEAMASNGLLETGYDRLNLDDCWMTYNRAENNSLQWNVTKFPHGLPWLGDYVKSKGFKFGVYEDSGNLTCGGYPGSHGYEELDAETFTRWGFDYLKLDGCNVYPENGRTLEQEYMHRYSFWHGILASMQHPLIFSESAPAYFVNSTNSTDWYTVMDWVPAFGELARHSTDILIYEGEGSSWDSIMVNYDFNTLLARYQKPGYYNDPDFLIPDHPDLSMEEKRSHFALWASFSAPLIISAYIPDLPKEDLSYLTNRDMIEVDQDLLAQQATLVSRNGIFDVLTRSLANGDRVLTVLNRGNSSASTSIPVDRLGLAEKCTYSAKNLWDGTWITLDGQIGIELASHATSVHRISLPPECSSVIPTGMVFNTASRNCLTGNTHSTVSFETCRGDDSQVWQVTASGNLRPLSAKSHCVTADGETVSLRPCKGSADQKWEYSVTGNLKNVRTGSCLTESSSGIGSCGLERDSQVFGLPSGVSLD